MNESLMGQIGAEEQQFDRTILWAQVGKQRYCLGNARPADGVQISDGEIDTLDEIGLVNYPVRIVELRWSDGTITVISVLEGESLSFRYKLEPKSSLVIPTLVPPADLNPTMDGKIVVP